MVELYKAVTEPKDTDNKSVFDINVESDTTLSGLIKNIISDKIKSGIILIKDSNEPLGEYIYKNGFIISTPVKKYTSYTVKTASCVSSGDRNDYIVELHEN